jgi:type I restriction enzyme, S subunit
MNSWPSKKMSEITSLVTDGKHGDCEDEDGSGYFFLSSKDLRDGKLNYDKPRQITHAGFLETHRRTNLEPGDVLLTNCGASIGRVGIAQDDPRIYRTTFQKSISVIKPDRSLVDGRYLYYFLLCNSRLLIDLGDGTAQPNLLIGDLKRIDVPVPPSSVQRRIAGILSAYDDLIENNQRRIKILEEMARSLYREWFVKFRFPGREKVPLVGSALGDIPQSWEVGRLDDVLVLQRGFDLPKADRVEGTIPIYAATGVTGFHSEEKVKAPGIVTGRSGTIGDVLYVQEDFWPLNTVLWVKEFPKAEPLYAYYVLSSLDLKQFNSGAAVPTLNRNDIHGFDTLIPPRPLQMRFQEIAGAMHAQTRILELQIQNLRRTRDLLLPRLLSGQLSLEPLG